MSFFKRLFGGTTEAEDRAEADRLFAAKNPFEARMAYEKLRDRKDASADTKAHASARINECLDGLANARIAEAERLISEGQLEMARGELESACELAKSESIRKRAARMLDTTEKRDARRAAREIVLDDDERWSVLAGTWSDAQLEEYDRYGESFRTALLTLTAGSPKGSRPTLESLARDHEGDGVYLFLEVARARQVDGDEDGACRALRLFLDRVPEEDRSDARIMGYLFLAQVDDKKGNDEKAVAHLERAVDLMPDDPRPLLNMGSFLRQKGDPESALTFIEAALSLIEEDQPNLLVQLELALAKRDVGQRAEAIEILERVVRGQIARAQLDIAPSIAIPLAEMHEADGNLARAADLYSTLGRGSDKANHVEYHRNAGRLLMALGLRQEARKMLARASALADQSSEISHDIEEILAELEREEHAEFEGEKGA